MLDFIRTRSRGQLAAAMAACLALIVVTALAVVGSGSGKPAARGASPGVPTLAPGTTSPPHTAIEGGPSTSRGEPIPPLPRTASADVYAAAVAKALLAIDYAQTDHASVMDFWRRQLATALPVGTPDGTTVAQAQDAAMSTISAYLASPAMWSTLAKNRTVAKFHVTSVREPAAWVAAVTAGKITDPGLTARTVVGVQTIRYGRGVARRSTTQSQEVTIAMLCPPTTPACSVEIIPPRDISGMLG